MPEQYFPNEQYNATEGRAKQVDYNNWQHKLESVFSLGFAGGPSGPTWNGYNQDDVFNEFRRHGIKEEDLAAAWERVINRGEKPGPVDPTVELANANKMQGVELKAAAGEGLGGLFGFAKNFGLDSPGLKPQGGTNAASPNQPGTPALPELRSQPALGPPNFLSGGR